MTEIDNYTTLTFESFYRATFPGLVGVATALMTDSTDAEDLVQDTMVKAFMRWPRVSVLAVPAAWCHRVLTNACRSRWRRRNTEQRYATRLRRRPGVINGPSGEALAFWEAVRTLPQRPRTVVALYFAGEHTTTEIVAILGIPEGTVRSDISRARDIIIEALR